MQMDFRVYQLTYDGDLLARGRDFYQYITNLPKFREHQLEYCITNEHEFEQNIVTFCFSEEYIPDLNSVDEARNSFSPNIDPFLNTFFSIDLQEKRMLVHHRDYPPNNLDRHQTMTRVSVLLNEAFQEVYNSQFNYLNTNRSVAEEDFLEVFRNNRITMLRVKLFETGRNIRAGSTIFQESTLNNQWIVGWNEDESDMHEIILKAPGRGGEGDLRDSPIARSLINLQNKEIVELNYWDEESGSNLMSRTDLRKFRIRGINNHTQPITAVNTIANEVYSRRPELRNFIATRQL
jgi:hypothetical protein